MVRYAVTVISFCCLSFFIRERRRPIGFGLAVHMLSKNSRTEMSKLRMVYICQEASFSLPIV